MQAEKGKLTSNRCSSIDFIKGVCILFVIITHYKWQEEERLAMLFPFWIDMAVPLFMIISGFLHTGSFRKDNAAARGGKHTIILFVCKVIRYSIPYTIAFVIAEVAFNTIGAAEHTISDSLLAFLCGGYGPGGYYYPIIIQFLFYFPVIYAVIRKYDFKGFIICGAVNVFYEILKTACCMSEEWYRLLVFRYTLLIAYGCYMAMGKYRRHRVLSVVCIAVGLLYIIVCKYFGVVPPITNYWTGTSVWACLFIIPLSGPMILSKCRNRIIETVGRASYHIFLVQMVYYSGGSLVYNLVPNRWLQLVVNLVVCVIIGLVFYYLETPITNKVLGYIRNRFSETKQPLEN